MRLLMNNYKKTNFTSIENNYTKNQFLKNRHGQNIQNPNPAQFYHVTFLINFKFIKNGEQT